jgi:hypothetical protein
VGLRQELTEPWGLVAAGILGGLGGAVTTGLGAGAIAVGLGVGAAVCGVKVAAGLMAHGGTGADGAPGLLRPRQGSPAAVWLRRAERTVRTLHDQTESPREPAVRSQVGEVDDEAATVLDALRRLADRRRRRAAPHRRAAVADRAASDDGCRWPQPSSEQMPAERQRSLDSVDQQLEVAARLDRRATSCWPRCSRP